MRVLLAAAFAVVAAGCAVPPESAKPVGLTDIAERPAEKALLAGIRAYDDGQYVESEKHLDAAAPVHVGHVAVATALAWIEFRELSGFRTGRPRLVDWFDRFAKRASMQATPLSGETADGIRPER